LNKKRNIILDVNVFQVVLNIKVAESKIEVIAEFIDGTGILETEDYKKKLGEELVQSIVNDIDSSS
jgi:hypothetical protein